MFFFQFFIVGLKIFEKFSDPEIIRKKKLETFLNDVEKKKKKIGQKRAGRNLAIKVYELAKNQFHLVHQIQAHNLY